MTAGNYCGGDARRSACAYWFPELAPRWNLPELAGWMIAAVVVDPVPMAVTMAVAPKMPPAPGLLSGTTATPKARLALSAKARNTASLGPPAGQGTIKLMGLLGNLSCAHAARLMSAGAAMLATEAARPCKV